MSFDPDVSEQLKRIADVLTHKERRETAKYVDELITQLNIDEYETFITDKSIEAQVDKVMKERNDSRGVFGPSYRDMLTMKLKYERAIVHLKYHLLHEEE